MTIYVIWRLDGADFFVTRLDDVTPGLEPHKYLEQAYDAEQLEIVMDEDEEPPPNPFVNGGSPESGYDLITIFHGEITFVY